MEIIWLLIGLLGGGVVGVILQKSILKKDAERIIKEAESKAETIQKERALQGKERFLKQKEEHEELIKDRERRMQSNEDRFRIKEKTLNQKLEEIGRKEKDLEKTQSDYQTKATTLEVRTQELDKIQQKQITELSKIAQLSPEDAKQSLMQALTDEARTAAMAGPRLAALRARSAAEAAPARAQSLSGIDLPCAGT
jgi:ribonuclease Y